MSKADGVLYDASRTDIVLCLTNGYGILSQVLRSSYVSGVERFVARYTSVKVSQHLAEKGLVSQDGARHAVDYVSRNETFVRSFRRQT